jgi:hypothetical protein
MNWWEQDLETVGKVIAEAVVPALVTALTPIVKEELTALEAALIAKIESVLGGKPA